VEAARKAIRQEAASFAGRARLSAMTTTRAIFSFEDLQSRSPFDLVVFDEASQVGLAQALALVPLGKRALFAGDPKQLAPIVRDGSKAAETWLGRSMFSAMSPSAPSTCRLNEQSRMAEPICRLVSNLFYGGNLVVAEDKKKDFAWLKERELRQVPSMGNRSVYVEPVAEEAIWSARYHGPIRHRSAKAVCNLVAELSKCTPESDILVLTPFRAQRTVIRDLLRQAGRGRVSVSTVHRAQGSERHSVIFDPVEGNNNFLKTEDARRLVNVALSRAKARLVLLLSPGDRQNPLFGEVAKAVEGFERAAEIGRSTKAGRVAQPIESFVTREDFPACCVGMIVQIREIVGRVEQVLSGDKFELLDLSTGEQRKFSAAVLKKNANALSPA
jgi:superfamily I DNA and/or RNA helicase